MEKGGLTRSTCLIAAAGTAAIAVIGFSTWRYDVALSRAAAALSERADATATAALTIAFWHERQAADLYITAPQPAAWRAATAQYDHFQRLAGQLGGISRGAGARSRARAVAANAHYHSVFSRASRAAGTTAAREGVAAGQLEAAAARVMPPLGALERSVTLRAAAAQVAAATAARQSRGIGIAAVLIVIAIGNVLGSFVLRLLGRAFRRARHLMSALGRLGDALGRLGDRDRLLAQLSSTSAVLGGVAGELRSAARNAADVGSQQSAAVAATSATIEELATTAGSIAGSVRRMAEVAGRTGGTMRDMQEKVQAIADRALSLGERAQKIGEILQMINDIAGQTNLLALNAEGTRQAREVGELMASTATMLDESILATQQQKSAADQVDGAIQQIRDASDQLAAEQMRWSATAERLDTLVAELDSALHSGAERSARS